MRSNHITGVLNLHQQIVYWGFLNSQAAPGEKSIERKPWNPEPPSSPNTPPPLTTTTTCTSSALRRASEGFSLQSSQKHNASKSSVDSNELFLERMFGPLDGGLGIWGSGFERPEREHLIPTVTHIHNLGRWGYGGGGGGNSC